ncbi:hypothetical protein IHQ56_14250 [Methylobacillus flagellatus]|uniref:hypothetical protein n=1 Tax=Methylobacillus flagellatus TaxID=405 RepID=UPI002853B8CA|nr:hypothetical protein [Methylobacillus flagellatus]MDR5172970.1 hypothetical protein [Methylobacillus flagellatus]
MSGELKRNPGFPNMAGKPDIDDALAAELEAAGIEVHRFAYRKDPKHEVSTEVIGSLHGWKFERAWYYWRCEGPGIELAAAERLHASHGREVRVAGHCGHPSPREWYKGLAVDSYHVDTPAGLKALADTIRALVDRAAAPAPAEAVPEQVAKARAAAIQAVYHFADVAQREKSVHVRSDDYARADQAAIDAISRLAKAVQPPPTDAEAVRRAALEEALAVLQRMKDTRIDGGGPWYVLDTAQDNIRSLSTQPPAEGK